MENEILQQAVDTLIQTPYYQFSVTPHPRTWYAKLLAKYKIRTPKPKTYTLQHLTGGNAYRVTKKILEIPEAAIREGNNAVLRDMYSLFVNHLDKVAYIVAVGIVNSREEPPQSLIDALMWEVPEEQLRTAALQMVKHFNIGSFTNTIVLIAGMDLITPAKEKTSPQVPGASSAG